MSDPARERFLGFVLADPTVRAVLDRAPALGLQEWWPGTGVRDADLFYFDRDTSWDAEDQVIREAERWQRQWPELTVLPWESGRAAAR